MTELDTNKKRVDIGVIGAYRSKRDTRWSHAVEHLLQRYLATPKLFSRALNYASEIVSAPPRGAPGHAR